VAGPSIDIVDVLQSRRSIRRFEATPVPDDLVQRLITAAGHAPSAGNAQPWRFLVITDKSIIEKMADQVITAALSVGRRLENEAQTGFLEYSRNFSKFSAAPLVIVPTFRSMVRLSLLMAPSAEEDNQRLHIETMERDAALASISMAVQNLLLCAAASGLGACIMTGPLFAHSALKELLKVSLSWELMGVIPVGFPAETPLAPPRRELSRIIRRILPAQLEPDESPTAPKGESR
jgi:nitroreductase